MVRALLPVSQGLLDLPSDQLARYFHLDTLIWHDVRKSQNHPFSLEKTPMPLRLAVLLAALLIAQNGRAEDSPPKQERASRTSVFNEKWLDAVVSIERVGGNGKSEPIGTGFLLKTARQHVLLITAKHIITDSDGTVIKSLAFLLNRPTGGTDLILDANLKNEQLGDWFVSMTHDIACRFIAWPESSKPTTIPQSAIMRAASLTLVPRWPSWVSR
jgi:hypothetical protein